MPRVNALSIFESENTQAKLNEIQAGIVENIQKKGISFRLKSQNANLDDETAGTFNFKRFQNSESKDYGTARTNNKGDKLTAPETPVSLDTDKEIVEEVAAKDAKRFGIDKSLLSIVEKRKANHEMTLLAELETAFFAKAVEKGTKIPGINFDEDIADQMEDIIQAIETTKNKYVRGVPRDLIAITCRPKVYGKLKNYLNNNYNANFSVAEEELPGLNGVAVFSNVYLPDDVDFVVMVKESVAQPTSIDEYNGERIPLSNDYAVELFYSYGTEALAPDLIKYGKIGDYTPAEA